MVERPQCGALFSSIFNNQAFSVTFALCDSYNHAHEPGLHMWPSQGPRPYSKQWKLDIDVGY